MKWHNNRDSAWRTITKFVWHLCRYEPSSTVRCRAPRPFRSKRGLVKNKNGAKVRTSFCQRFGSSGGRTGVLHQKQNFPQKKRRIIDHSIEDYLEKSHYFFHLLYTGLDWPTIHDGLPADAFAADHLRPVFLSYLMRVLGKEVIDGRRQRRRLTKKRGFIFGRKLLGKTRKLGFRVNSFIVCQSRW